MRLDEWFAARDGIRQIYRDELGRDVVADPDAEVNWLYHFREDARDLAWIRSAVRESPEWRAAHGVGQTRPTSGVGIQTTSADATVRGVYSASEIASFVPARSGPFTFPAPYGTQAVRLTDDRDGLIEPSGYGYWRKINAHEHESSISVVVGRGEAPALLVRVEKATLAVSSEIVPDLRGTGEQWYFSASDPDVLFVCDGSRALRRVDVLNGLSSDVFSVQDDCYVWQCHSSADERRHSATLRDRSTDRALASIVYDERTKTLRKFDAKASLDECQIDASGRWLLIKEGDDNRIVDIDASTPSETFVSNEHGAVGHSDNGFGYAIGEDDFHARPGAFVMLDFAQRSASPLIYHTTNWQAMARHVSHTNAPRPRVLLSSACRVNVPRANELVVAPLDGSLTCTVVAPNLVDLDASGGDGPATTRADRDYRKLPKANLDPYGEWACWTANCGTDRLDAFLVRIP